MNKILTIALNRRFPTCFVYWIQSIHQPLTPPPTPLSSPSCAIIYNCPFIIIYCSLSTIVLHLHRTLSSTNISWKYSCILSFRYPFTSVPFRTIFWSVLICLILVNRYSQYGVNHPNPLAPSQIKVCLVRSPRPKPVIPAPSIRPPPTTTSSIYRLLKPAWRHH